MLLEGSLFMSFFEKVEVANFEVASDAFSTFKVSDISGRGLLTLREVLLDLPGGQPA